MSKATTDDLSVLHSKIAESMLKGLEQSTTAGNLLNKERDVQLPADVIDFLEDISVVSPSFLTAVTKFLKDNDITCDPSENDDLEQLRKQIASKRKGSVTKIPYNA